MDIRRIEKQESWCCIARKLVLYHKNYIRKVLKNFNMQDDKPVSKPLLNHFRLSSNQCPKNEKKLKTCQSCDAQVFLDINCVVWVFMESHVKHIAGCQNFINNYKKFQL